MAEEIILASEDKFQKTGIQQYLLEVLQNNTGAIALYKRMGFEVTRTFDYYTAILANLNLSSANLKKGYEFRYLTTLSIVESLEFMDFYPSWQNTFDSVGRDQESFVVLAAFYGNVIVGFAIVEPTSGDLTQLAVKPSHRRNGIGSLLLATLLDKVTNKFVKCVNLEQGHNSLPNFIIQQGFSLTRSQYEMIKQLK